MYARRIAALLIIILVVGAAFYSLRRCTAPTASYSLTAEDSAALADFQQEIIADSLHHEAERQRRWDSIRHSYERPHRPLSEKARAYLEDQHRWDSLRAARPEKLTEGSHIELTTADSSTLTKIPLIGPARAKQILAYGQRLGGYVDVRQLTEINNMPPEIVRWFTIDPQQRVRRLRLNHDDFQTLVRHPYLSFDQVKAIVNYRRRFGPLKSWDDLSLTHLFSDQDIERLTPYTTFD